MGFTAASLTQFATRVAAARAALWAAVLTFETVDYACVIDPEMLTQILESGGFDQDRGLMVIVATATGMVPVIGRNVTIKTTATDALETLVFRIRGIRNHPDNPEIVLMLEKNP